MQFLEPSDTQELETISNLAITPLPFQGPSGTTIGLTQANPGPTPWLAVGYFMLNRSFDDYLFGNDFELWKAWIRTDFDIDPPNGVFVGT